MKILIREKATILSRQPISIEETLEELGSRINHAVKCRNTSIKLKRNYNTDAVIGALLALDYMVEEVGNSWIKVSW